jgi:hypothetical protein
VLKIALGIVSAVLMATAIDSAASAQEPSSSNSSCDQVIHDYNYQEHQRPMSDGWKRAVLYCIPGLSCDATCADFAEEEKILKENRAIERKWVFDCNGTFTTGNGETINKTNFEAHHDDIYQDFLKKKREVCKD